MATFADRVGVFNRKLHLSAALPAGVNVMNPYTEGALALTLSDAFYQKYFADNNERHLILGINPGRFGGALTGIPFTDFKRLEQYCEIDARGQRAHEPSSEFIYAMIAAMGGPSDFYSRFMIHSVCPLGFTIANDSGREVNYNYYDDAVLFESVKPFIVKSLHQLLGLGCNHRRVFCLGVKNTMFLRSINDAEQLFDDIVALPHPRYIMQYRRRYLDAEIERYRQALSGA